MLTDAKIRAARPRAKPFKISDSAGLHLYITPAGSRTWRLKYRFAGREKLLTIGPYPAFTLARARQARDDAKAALLDGRDPSALKRRRQLDLTADRPTFEAVAREWHALQAPLWTEHHASDVLRSLERDIFPEFGREPVTEISAPMVLDALRRVEARSALETAHRIRQRVSAVFTYAIAAGIGAADPAAIVRGALKPIGARGQRPALLDLEAVRGTLRDAEAVPAHPQTKLALRLLALTVMRPGEVRKAERSEFVDLDGPAPLWNIPAERMKMKRDFVVPLAPAAVDVVRAALALAGRGRLLFPSPRRAYGPISENAMGYLLNRAGYYGRHVPHGFRASFSTIMNERFPLDRKVIDFMLAHSPKDEIEAAYNRSLYLERRRELAGEWAGMMADGLPPALEMIDGPRRA